MRLTIFCSVAVLLLSFIALPAAAQVAGGPVTVTIVDLPPGPANVRAGQTHSVPFTVNVQAAGFQCTGNGALTLALAITSAASPPGVSPSVDPPNVTIAVPAGVYQASPVPGAPVAPFNGSATATLRVATTAAAAGPYSASVSATFPGGTAGQGCVGDLPEGSDTKTHAITIAGQAPPGNGTSPPPPGPGNGTGNGTSPPPSSPPPAPENRGLPGFEPLLLAAAGMLALATRRRR